MAWDLLTTQSAMETYGSRALGSGTYEGIGSYSNSGVVNQGVMVALSATSPAFVQKAISSHVGNTTSTIVAFASPNAHGNCLILDIYFTAGSYTAGPVTVTDSQGNVWTQAVSGFPAFQGYFMQTWIAAGVAAGANTITVSIGGVLPFASIALAAHEYKGVSGTVQNAAYADGPLFGTGTPVTLTVLSSGGALLHVAFSPKPVSVSGGGFTPCSPAWLTILEPTSVSPFVPGAWTDQSHKLHVSESITFSWIVRQRGTVKIPLILDAEDTYEPTIGAQVCLWDITETDDFEVFSGTIDDYETKWLGDTGERIVTLTCVSLEQVFDTIRLPSLLFEDMTAGAIFTAVFAYANGSPIVLGTVDAGAAVANFLISDFPTIADVFTRLATLSGYVWGIDPGTGSLYFHAPETTPSPFVLDAEDVLWEQFTLREERHDYRNKQINKVNSDIAVLSSEYFQGAGQSSFTMLRPINQITNAWLTQNTQNQATGTFTGQPAPGDTISFQFPTSGSGFNWSAGGTYTAGQIIVDSNGYIQKCTVGGTTGGSEPIWVEIYGQFTTDNTVQWQNQGQAGFSDGSIATYKFVTALNNTKFGEVLIGSNLTNTITNLWHAINSIQDFAGVTFSLPTWENPQVNAYSPTSTTLIVRNKAAGAGFTTALSKSCANFSWNHATTTGGVTTFGTTAITFGVAGQTVGGTVFTIVYTPGSNIVTSATPLNVGDNIQIEYTAANNSFIQVENTADVILRAEIESGTGKYQQSASDDTSLSLPQALALAQQQLAAYGVIPKTFEFTTMRAGLYVGQVLQIAMASPANAPALINASWFIQEINAEVVPVYGEDGVSDRWLPGGGHFRYTVRCIDVAQIGSWIDFWLNMAGGGSGGGSSQIVTGGGSQGSNPGGSNSYSTAFASSASVTVLHGLNTTAVVVMVYDASGNQVIPSGLQVTNANTVILTFGVAMAGSVVVIGA